MIEFRKVGIRAGDFSLENLCFRVDPGEYVALMGRTGEGKTTILEAACGLRRVTAGSILLDNHDVTHLKPAQRQIGYVPQDLVLFPTMTVQQQLEFALEVRNVNKTQRKKRVEQLSELLGITGLLPRKISGLSGGESQRVALGRALSFEPSVLLLDEPLSALDEETRMAMHELLRNIQQRTQVTTLHVTHSRNDAEALADRILLLENHDVVEKPLARSPKGNNP